MKNINISYKKILLQILAFIALLIFMGNLLFLILFHELKFTGHLFLIVSVNSVLVGGIFAIVIGGMANILDKKLPWLHAPLRRLIVQVVLTIILVMLIIVIAIPILGLFWNQQITSDVFLSQMFFMMKVAFSFLLVGTLLTNAIMFFKNWKEAAVQQEKLKREQLALQYETLKSQVNPHFLFNNLNTIYALAEKGDHRTKDLILQLSDFLRYVLYDTSSEKIGLEKEIEIIKTYVGLQKERINENTTEVILNIQGDFTGIQIAPLLLLPLAENCFKHGIGKDKGTIGINISFVSHQLHFSTKNRIERRENPLNHEQGGIGILNVEKRLNLLYPGKHQLTFEKNGDLFMIEMTIDLD